MFVKIIFTVLALLTSSIYGMPDHIRPAAANHIDAPLPVKTDPDLIVGIYGNILYPQDKEQIQQKKLTEWINACAQGSTDPFPLSPEELNDISLYKLERLPFEEALCNSCFGKTVQEISTQASRYKEVAEKVPFWKGRCETLIAKLKCCADQIEKISNWKKKEEIDLIDPPFTWEMRVEVFKQTIDRITSKSPNAPYFLALQEVTPEALSDLKKALSDRDLQWISFNNLSNKETLPPQQEETLGESTAFTSTLALSPGLEILKIELGDLPTESGSVRKILGVRVRNADRELNLFTTHTDYVIQNDLYGKTATSIHSFVTQFLSDASSEQRFVLGGDLNAFEHAEGGKYIKTLRDLLPRNRDFRETDYYAPHPIAWSTFIGRYDDVYAERIAKDGIVEPSALDHIIVGSEIELQSATREAAVYNDSGQLLDYYEQREEYLNNLQNKITFSDHFFNIVRLK